MREPDGELRAKCFRVIQSKAFEYAMTTVVFANTVCMAFNSYHMSETLVRKLEIANAIFVVIYNIEMVIKLLGLGKQ